MKTAYRQRDVRFDLIDGSLVRTVREPTTGRAYRQRCGRQTYEAVARAIDQIPAKGRGADCQQFARLLDLPFTQVNVALEFMKERGCVTTRGRRNYRASNFAFEDAMVEFLALSQGEQ